MDGVRILGARTLTTVTLGGVTYHVPLVSAAGRLEVDVIAVPLPPGAATLLEQQVQSALLMLLTGALNSVGVDTLLAQVVASALPAGASTLAEQQVQTIVMSALANALASIGLDNLLVQVTGSTLPIGASTLAEQQTQTVALQLIDDLQNALASVGADTLRSLTVPLTAVATNQAVIAVANNAVQLSAGQPCQAVSVAALNANVAPVYIGVAAVTPADGRELANGAAVDLAVDDVNRLWVNSANVGDGVSWIALN